MIPTACEGGYFLVADIRNGRHLVPDKYLDSHKYLPDGERPDTRDVNMPNGDIPLDLAMCRWLACEKNLALMPCSFFYDPKSPNLNENYVRLAICKDIDSLKAAGAAMHKN